MSQAEVDTVSLASVENQPGIANYFPIYGVVPLKPFHKQIIMNWLKITPT
jgi:hypothetical protein